MNLDSSSSKYYCGPSQSMFLACVIIAIVAMVVDIYKSWDLGASSAFMNGFTNFLFTCLLTAVLAVALNTMCNVSEYGKYVAWLFTVVIPIIYIYRIYYTFTGGSLTSLFLR